MQPRHRTESNEAEIRLMGLILSQSALVGLAVGIYDSGIWLVNDSEFVNGLTYAMGAFAVQGLAYYFFKMFFDEIHILLLFFNYHLLLIQSVTHRNCYGEA